MAGVRPVVIIVRDGWGVRDDPDGNAVLAAKIPHHRELWSRFPTATINASEHHVGLPAGQFGNSEVGHLNMGGGRVVYQDFTRISKSIEDGSFFQNDALGLACQRAEERNRSLHLVGLCSDGGVHSHLDHLYALLELARRRGVRRAYIHALTDGRDTAPGSAPDYLRQILEKTRAIGLGELATVGGRYHGMDRDKRWDRVKKHYDAIFHGRSPWRGPDAVRLVEESIARGKTDEFVEPSVVTGPGDAPLAPFRRGDQVVFWNFRADRARQLSAALCDPAFDAFDREGGSAFELTAFCEYEAHLPFAGVAYAPVKVSRHLSAYIAELGHRQFKCAETEKYAHVTFFWNGGEEAPCAGEDRTLVESPKVATYDLKPEMSAAAVTDAVVARLGRSDDGLVVVNFANADMVGHTGVFDAAVRACEVVDDGVGRIVEAALHKEGAVIVTADHGNVETMIDPVTRKPHTAHTTNPVHAIVVAKELVGRRLRPNGSLADLAPTALGLQGLPVPQEMTGRTLVLPA